jgi:hypothetical protein
MLFLNMVYLTVALACRSFSQSLYDPSNLCPTFLSFLKQNGKSIVVFSLLSGDRLRLEGTLLQLLAPLVIFWVSPPAHFGRARDGRQLCLFQNEQVSVHRPGQASISLGVGGVHCPLYLVRYL